MKPNPSIVLSSGGKTMKTRKNSTKLWIVFALLGCGLALIALAGQGVSAQPVSHDLKLPFRFAERVAAPEAQTPPPGSTELMTETFGASFNPITSTSGTTPQWRVFTNQSDTARYYWDKVDRMGVTVPIAFSSSAWSAAKPITTSPVLTPGVSPYPAGQDSWLIYGPIDLSKFSYGHLSFEYYLDSRAGDTLLWGYSTDGQTFYGNSQSGPLGTWITDTFAFRTNSTSQAVYLAFAFSSQAAPQGKGAFVRNVRLTGEPLKYAYMPIALKDYAAPTPTPIPPLYGYYFDETDPYASGSDLSKWGGQFYGTRPGSYGSYAYGQDVRLNHGNPKNSLTLYTTATYIVNASSPNNTAPADFDLYVDMSPWRLYKDNRYGIVFNASSNTFGTTPAQFNGNGQFYLLYVATGEASSAPRGIRLDVCAGGGCTRLSGNSQNEGYIALPPGFVGNASAFDSIHLQRLGNQITVWANGVQMFSLTNGTYVSNSKWGLFILPYTNDSTYPPIGTQMQVDFDNIRMYEAP
jgi:hypothetical protein